ncbi:hypothetical protein [Nocardioides sp. SYSU DS0663]|uniref:hypothetical protein n=1 Tax=Nocardioides sp. SYSU DS0663 TaxID=3416445 RepID=UPI003F4BF765
MKLPSRPALRRSEPAAEEVPAAPRPPRGRPVAQYAAVLDGRRLWLAFAPEAGSPGMSDTATGEVLVPTPELSEDEPRWRSVRLDLDALPWRDGAAYDLVLVRPGGRGARPLWSPPLAPARTTPTADGTHRYDVVRTEDGGLRVQRRTVEPAATLERIEVLPGGLRLTLTAPAATDRHGEQGEPGRPDTVSLVADDGTVVAAYPVAAGGGLTCTLAEGSLPVGMKVRTRVVLGTPGDGPVLPVRRRADVLPDVRTGAPLPVYESERGLVAALRWNAEGLLTLQVRPGEEGR